jgi:uncharacterized membrane protein YdbT with pleckstrin-like domain
MVPGFAGELVPEQIIWEGMPSLRLTFPPLLVVGTAYVLAALLQLVFQADRMTHLVTFSLAFLIGFAVFVRQALLLRACYYRLTTDSIYVRRGLFDRVTEHVSLDHFRDVFVEENSLAKILGCGDVEIISGNVASEQVCFEGVHHPVEIKELVLKAVADRKVKQNPN